MQKRGFLLIILFLLFPSLLNCKKNTPVHSKVEEVYSFQEYQNKIMQYPIDKSKYQDYYDVYLETRNIFYSINKVNYPSFLQESVLSGASLSIPLVNQYNLLSEDYQPKNLRSLKEARVDFIERGHEQYADEKALIAIESFLTKAAQDGYHFTIFSAYRTKEYQASLYKDGSDPFVARPRASEHETGLAFDIGLRDYGLLREAKKKEYDYFLKTMLEFGFILRYPKGKERITGIPFESWHIRYVGKTQALIMNKYNLALEEYLYWFTLLPVANPIFPS